MVNNLPAMQETWVWSLGWEDPLEKGKVTWEWLFLPGEFHGQRKLKGHSPWGRKELDMIVFHLLRGNSKVGINRQRKEAANLKRGCEAEEHKKWTEPKEPVECQQPDQYTHCGSSRRKKRERGRENMGRNNDWKLPKSDERQYVLTVEYCSAFQS